MHKAVQSYQENSYFMMVVFEFKKIRTSADVFPDGINLFKVNNGIIRTMCETFSNLTIKTAERCQWDCSGVFIANFEYVSHNVLVFLLITLKRVNTG